MQNVLLIGGAGYIGSHIVFKLCDLGYNVKVLDDLSSGFKENVDTRAKFIHGSIFNDNILNQAIANVDSVIHLAALKDAGESMINPLLYTKQNIQGSLVVLKSCVKNNVKKIVFSSTAAVYGDPSYLPLDEDHPTSPINYYGYTKLCVERNLFWFSEIYGIKVACLRYFNATGYDLKNKINKVEKNPSNLLPIVMETLIGKRSELEVYGKDYNTDDGTCLRDYIHVNDLADAHSKSLEFLDSNNKSICVNLATGSYHSVLDVIKEAQDVSGRSLNYRFVKRRQGDPPKLYAKSNLAKDLLNWSPKYSDLNTILKSKWNVYKKLL